MNSQNAPELSYLDAHSSRIVQFTVKLKGAFPITHFSDKNFLLRINAEIESPTVPPHVNASKTYSVTKHESKVAGAVTLQTRAYFRDADAGFLNNGTVPPHTGKPTQFTIHWILKNFAADLSGVDVRANLPEGVRFTGQAKSNFGPAPIYDQSTNQVIWALSQVQANKGVIDQPLEAIFQVEATPAQQHIGLAMPLLSDTLLKGTDVFIGKEFIVSAPMLTTAIPDDTTLQPQERTVQP